MGNSKSVEIEQLIDALRLRYDSYSATAIFELGRERAGLPQLPAYDATQVRTLRAALDGIADRMTAVDLRLESLLAESASVPAATTPSSAQVAPAAPVAPAVPTAQVAPAAPAAQVAPAAPGVPAAPVAPATTKADAAPIAATALAPGPAAVAAAPTSQPAARARSSAPSAAPVRLTVTGVKVDKGVVVMACGGTPALGDWDAAHALALTESGEEWIAALDLALGTEFEFKLLQRGPDGQIVWERGPNRAEVAAPEILCQWR
jgi:Starch binding domain